MCLSIYLLKREMNAAHSNFIETKNLTKNKKKDAKTKIMTFIFSMDRNLMEVKRNESIL